MKTIPLIADLVYDNGEKIEKQPIEQSRYFYFAPNGLRFDYSTGQSLNHVECDLDPCRIVMGTIRPVPSKRAQKKFTFTHWGIVRHSGLGGPARVRLRETVSMWIDEKGRKFHKTANNWHTACGSFVLRKESITPLDSSGAIPRKTRK